MTTMTATQATLEIDQSRLWDALMVMAEIGKTERGGSGRLTLTELDKQARQLFIRWCEEIGCTVTVDRIGNLFARREGKRPDLEPIAFGSHLDTQPKGGRFDGVLGVLAGLEVLRTLHEHDIVTERPLLLVNWTNEEGSRFAPAMVASGVYAGEFTHDYILSRTDRDGVTFAEALRKIGFEGDAAIGEPSFARFFELHIEQGPVLEEEALDIGVVTGVQGMRWYDITFTGQAVHAGTTPLSYRNDALCAASRLIDSLTQHALTHDPDAKVTFGELTIPSSSRNVAPGEVRLTVDLRHTSTEKLDALEIAYFDKLAEAGETYGVMIDQTCIWDSPVVAFNDDNIASVEASAKAHGFGYKKMMSGAGHDAVYISKIKPTSMIFVPCLKGISHNEAEYSSPEQCAKGAQVLCDVVVEHANRV
ncbi:M20 family metallo-hydrolase [Phytohalomonas tamaricis]|uniref:M20 family metallo-hydrolase n=1 Tax=Phytohalomonas tamaricis TaxID=2081032 RepID=UPI0021D46E3B|nr:M20 family metallo-hydrolase [Phytohalomonas tamaricis]